MGTKRALISVSNKKGIVEFARGIVELGFEIISTGGTKKMIKADERYFAEISDSETGEPFYLDNEIIEASNDQEAIGKANEWAASHRLGVVAMLIVKQGLRGVHSRKIYLSA